MDYEEALGICEQILDLTDDIPEAGQSFADSVREKTEGIQYWIEENEHCTEAQGSALENMLAGVERWLERY